MTAHTLGKCILPDYLENRYSGSVKILSKLEAEKVKLLLTNFQDFFQKEVMISDVFQRLNIPYTQMRKSQLNS